MDSIHRYHILSVFRIYHDSSSDRINIYLDTELRFGLAHHYDRNIELLVAYHIFSISDLTNRTNNNVWFGLKRSRKKMEKYNQKKKRKKLVEILDLPPNEQLNL
ncbi:hypothetical protein BLOT_015390 [Blomia tropicalis]|nr:hypothetical protein BLOT_015390 [Blomia tropicalis]